MLPSSSHFMTFYEKMDDLLSILFLTDEAERRLIIGNRLSGLNLLFKFRYCRKELNSREKSYQIISRSWCEMI
jgi:hypothetical protein